MWRENSKQDQFLGFVYLILNTRCIIKTLGIRLASFGRLKLFAGDCPTGWLNGGDIGGCYLFVVSSNGVTYNEAITICESNGGFLTDILNQETQDLLANFGRSQNYQDLVWTIGSNGIKSILKGLL